LLQHELDDSPTGGMRLAGEARDASGVFPTARVSSLIFLGLDRRLFSALGRYKLPCHCDGLGLIHDEPVCSVFSQSRGPARLSLCARTCSCMMQSLKCGKGVHKVSYFTYNNCLDVPHALLQSRYLEKGCVQAPLQGVPVYLRRPSRTSTIIYAQWAYETILPPLRQLQGKVGWAPLPLCWKTGLLAVGYRRDGAGRDSLT
jgi:hypothetical protein